jgi:hypothetical protein
MDIKVFTLNGKDIALCIDPYADCPGNAPQIFAMGAEKDIGNLKIVKNDLFDRFFS